MYCKLAESESKVTGASVPREYTIGNPPPSPEFCVTKITDDVAAYEEDIALLILPEKYEAVDANDALLTLLAQLAVATNDAVRAKDDVKAYDADTALVILPEKYEAVSAYEADVALLILPEKYEAVRAKDAVFAFKAINAMSALVVVPIRLIICYKYQSLYSW